MKNIVLAQATSSGPGGLDILVFGIIWLGIVYILMIRPQRIKAKKHQTAIEALKVGDTVITQGGLYGTIQKVEPSFFIIEIDKDKQINVKVARSGIQAFNNTTPSPTTK